MSLLTKEQILAAKDDEIEIVNVKEWGGDVGILVMTGAARSVMEAKINALPDGVNVFENFRSYTLAKTLCDKDGKLLFEEADIEQLSKKSYNVIEKLYKIASEKNGLGADEVKKLQKK